MPDCIRIRLNNICVYPGRGKTGVYKTLINSYVRPWASRSSPIARGGRQRETTSTFCTSHVYDDTSAMTMSSRTCLRAENSSASTLRMNVIHIAEKKLIKSEDVSSVASTT